MGASFTTDTVSPADERRLDAAECGRGPYASAADWRHRTQLLALHAQAQLVAHALQRLRRRLALRHRQRLQPAPAALLACAQPRGREQSDGERVRLKPLAQAEVV